ncbi:MAG: DUF885 domain-containing protein [Actinomycetaceae bacterium]|nr:DUF885 domain-containing protein [Actinomycetaceae bacterium]
MRTPSPLDHVAEDYVDRLVQLQPETAIDIGAPLGERTISNFSPSGEKELSDLRRTVLARAKEAMQAGTADYTDVAGRPEASGTDRPASYSDGSQTDGTSNRAPDETDEVTFAALKWDLSIAQELADAGLTVGGLNNIDSPLQQIRDPFTLMPMERLSDWEQIIRRVEAVPQGYRSYIAGLEHALENGRIPTIVQVEAALKDLKAQRGVLDPYARLVQELRASDFADDKELKARLDLAVAGAQGATRDFATWLKHTVAPRAINRDGVGRDEYILQSAKFLGKRINPEETYEWALDELARIHARQQAIVDELFEPGLPVSTALENLNNDPQHQVHGTAELVRWMQKTSDAAMEFLAGRHFTVADEMRELACMISPAGDGGIFYTAPTDDFSRPGTMWWAVPPGVEVFHTWQEKTTVYHEGMPGHHMQLARAVSLKELNRWRRQLCWFSGHGEGWALYAEELMNDLGFLPHPAEQLGMLDAQRLRAARVLVDIGVHLGLKKPSPAYLSSIGISGQIYEDALARSPFLRLGDTGVADDTWDRNDLWAFMNANVAMDQQFLEFETTRYLGWPGQASSYKVGQRVWESVRDEWQKRHPGEPLRTFHDKALALGGLPLSVLEDVMGRD